MLFSPSFGFRAPSLITFKLLDSVLLKLSKIVGLIVKLCDKYE
jgi:hypothetical protein